MPICHDKSNERRERRFGSERRFGFGWACGPGQGLTRNEGRQRLHRLNGQALKPIHDWVKQYENAAGRRR